MGSAVKWGVILAVGVSLVSAVLIGSGMHTNPMASGLISIVIFIGLNIAAVVMALKATSGTNGYLAQLGSGVVLGVVGAVLIFALSYLITGVVFPDSIQEMVEANLEMLGQAGLPQEQLEAQAEKMRATTPVSQAMSGAIGTVITSVVVAAIAAIFQRRK